MSSWGYEAKSPQLLEVRECPKCLEDFITNIYDRNIKYAMKLDDTEGFNEEVTRDELNDISDVNELAS